MVGNAYFNNLIMTVINASERSEWVDAVDEWEIYDCEEDEDCTSKCLCGKENIRYLYTIRNKYNGEMIFPIGSSCINKFGRKDLKDETGLIEEQFRLLHAVESNKYLSLSAEFFSRKLLRWLFEKGAFDTSYNQFDGEEDYEFMLKMFNKRDKDAITIRQDKKIKAIIMNSIKPFLQERLAEKIR